MTSPTLVGLGARLPLLWIGFLIISAPVASAIEKGSFAHPENWALFTALFGAILGLVGLLAPWKRGLSRPRLHVPLMLTGAVITASVVVLIDTPAYEPSMFSVAIALCSAVILFGDGILGAVVGFALITVRAVAVVLVAPSPGLMYVIDVYPIALLMVSLVWLRYARRLSRREGGFRARASTALRELQQRERALAELRMRNSIASSGAHSALEQIVRTGVLTDDLHAEVRAAEAALRDHIRCPALEHPQLTTAIATARREGVNVLLLNASTDVGDPDDVIGDELATALGDLVRRASPGDDITVRLLARRTSEPIAVSVLLNRAGDGGSEDDSGLLEADQDGPVVLDAEGRPRGITDPRSLP
ncbi:MULTISPECIES: hypothetical protein [unclassified Microbacterium]|uniref:hypothetical protein n=1 Tax=unclassified Microbacterium TaxID=2609290 RepID=UPI000493A90E|nr:MULTISPECIES: hypothetical protein [unclassified Microbacterium]